jgi:hypothetical protein
VLAPTARFVSPSRIAQLAAVIKPSMLLKIHKLLVDHKYTPGSFSLRHIGASPVPKGRLRKSAPLSSG